MKKACIIGFGKLGLLHCCLINNYKNFKVTTIIEKNYILKLLLKIILPSEFAIYNNINNENLKNIDLVVIATQPGQTPKIIKKLYDIKFKKDVFLEKPGFINISDFYNNLNFIKSFRKFKVGYMLRYKKTFKILNKIIKKNKYGKPKKIFGYVYANQPLIYNKTWRKSKIDIGGGVVMLQGTHLIDLLLNFFGKISFIKSKNFYSGHALEHKSEISLLANDNIPIFIDMNTKFKKVRKLMIGFQIKFQNHIINVNEDHLEIFKGKKVIKKYYKNDFKENVFFEIGDNSYSFQIENLIKIKKNNNNKEIKLLKSNLNIIDKIYKHGTNFRT